MDVCLWPPFSPSFHLLPTTAAHIVPETLFCLWQGGTWHLGTRLSLLLASAGRWAPCSLSDGVTYKNNKRWIFICSWPTDHVQRLVNYVLPNAQTRLQCCFCQSLTGNPQTCEQNLKSAVAAVQLRIGIRASPRGQQGSFWFQQPWS